MKEVQVNGHMHLNNGNGIGNGTSASSLGTSSNGTNGYAALSGSSNGTTNGTSASLMSSTNGCVSKKQSVKCTCNTAEQDDGSDTNNNQGMVVIESRS
uniref:Uncharacterized protein n=1 Tax=Anopheles atroparvus TaxID=41427 RepID=A0A182IQS5_ANOAO